MVAFAGDIDLLQVGATSNVLRCHHLDQPHHLADEVVALAVQMVKKRVNGIEIGAQPRIKVAQITFADVRLEFVEDLIEQRMRDLFVHDLQPPIRRPGSIGR